MKTYEGVEVQLHALLTSTLGGVEWSSSRPARFTPGTHSAGGWVISRAYLDTVAKRKKKSLHLPVIEPRPSSQ
jgi:hypothetical protein